MPGVLRVTTDPPASSMALVRPAACRGPAGGSECAGLRPAKGALPPQGRARTPGSAAAGSSARDTPPTQTAPDHLRPTSANDAERAPRKQAGAASVRASASPGGSSQAAAVALQAAWGEGRLGRGARQAGARCPLPLQHPVRLPAGTAQQLALTSNACSGTQACASRQASSHAGARTQHPTASAWHSFITRAATTPRASVATMTCVVSLQGGGARGGRGGSDERWTMYRGVLWRDVQAEVRHAPGGGQGQTHTRRRPRPQPL